MKFSKLLLVPFLMLTCAFTYPHKYYVSITQVEYVQEKESVQIIIQMFTEDLEKLIHERYDKEVVLNTQTIEKKIDNYIDLYLSKKVQFKINNQPTEFKFVGKEYEDDLIFCYLEILNVPNISQFEASNYALFEMFEQQQNIIKTNINNQNDSFVLTPQNNLATITFK